MFALLLSLHYAVAKVPDSNTDAHVLKKIDSCPDVGYFFQRDVKPNTVTPSCHLCFCQDNGTAVCWPRRNRRCDIKNYHHYGTEARYKRTRRSPGFTDIFFRDAARDVFDKNSAQECKPFESSTSEGCPPADWCIGCTVCDCDANGHWDCHILSFCPDDKGKKKMKRRRGSLNNKIVKPQLQKKKPPPTTTKKPNKKQSTKHKKRSYKGKKSQPKINNKPMPRGSYNKGKIMKRATAKKTKPIYKQKILSNNKGKLNKKIIKKTTKPPPIRNKKGKEKVLDATDGAVKNVAQTILKRVMASVEKIVFDTHKNLNKSANGKFVQKRSMPKHYKTSHKKENKHNTKKKFPNKVTKNDQDRSQRKNWRSKRDISNLTSLQYSEKIESGSTKLYTIEVVESSVTPSTDNSNDLILITPVSNKITKSDYFSYNVDFEKNNVTGNHNIMRKENNFKSWDRYINKTDKDGFKVNGLKCNTLDVRYNTLKYIPKIISFLKSRKNVTGLSMKLRNKTLLNYNCSGNLSEDKGMNNKELITKNNTCDGIFNLKNILNKLSTYRKENSTKRKKTKDKQFAVLNYLKSVFRKIFKNKIKKSKKSAKRFGRNFNRRGAIKLIYKNLSGSCKLDPTNKILLLKVDQLSSESNRILNSVKIIKGLLTLLGKGQDNIRYNSTIMTNRFSNNDIKILNEIIRGNKDEEYKLTSTQHIQINHIKETTKFYLDSVEKFSHILKDIINILIKCNEENHKIKRRNFRCTETQIINKANANKTAEKKLCEIKKILSYHLVPNIFLKNLYDLLTTLTPNLNSTTERGKLLEVSSKDKKNSNIYATEKYTKDIVQSLRKLEDFVQKMSFNNRRKRAVMEDDDAVEYLLMLIEYMLKQNKPLDISPVNDGIDLLIDAIKNAPDIKPIKKKVLEYAPVQVNKYNDVTTNIASDRFNTFKTIDDDEEDSRVYNSNKKWDNHKCFNAECDANQAVKEDNEYNSSLVTKPDMRVDEFKKFHLEKMQNKEDSRRYDVFTDDIENEESIFFTSTGSSDLSANSFTTTVYNKPIRTTTIPSLREFEDNENVKDDQVSDIVNITFLNNNKKTKLEWVEEIPEENTENIESLVSSTTQAVTKAATRTVHKAAAQSDKYIDAISSMSREIVEEEKTKQVDPEYIVSRKQTNLLNSLDYGTETTDMEIDSKEDKIYNAESSPLYFV